MAKEEKPLDYERRERETKEVARRLNLAYLKRKGALALRKNRTAWLAFGLAAAASVALVLARTAGIEPGPVSPPHRIFELNCQNCHVTAFAKIPDSACLKCHDGPAHPAKLVDTARLKSPPACAQCHVEHRGEIELKKVSDGNCTACHSNLGSQATGVKLTNKRITGFRRGRHPEFSSVSATDTRPIRLNHVKHMPAKPTVIRNMKLPMKCEDCHVTDPNSPIGMPLPVTFEQNCRSCHARELEFDVFQLFSSSMPAPHTKDPKTIHEFIVKSYRDLLAAQPGLASRPVGNEVVPQPNPSAWLDRVVSASEKFLFEQKCNYCHEYSGTDQGFPVVKKVNRIQGHYVAAKPEGESWFARGEFSHRAHRAVQCESCHTKARDSAKTSDVLIPAMQQCLLCHADSRAGLDRCSECHLYHNKGLEKERERRPSQQIVSQLRTGGLP